MADEEEIDSIELPDGKIIVDEEMPVDLDDDLLFSETESTDDDSLFGGNLEADDY